MNTYHTAYPYAGSVLLLLIGAAVILSFALYFLPSIVAFARGHPNSLGIFLVNLIFGWTFLGWIAAMVWACITGPIITIHEHRRVTEEPDATTTRSVRQVRLEPTFRNPPAG
jgi:hypothetical protein